MKRAPPLSCENQSDSSNAMRHDALVHRSDGLQVPTRRMCMGSERGACGHANPSVNTLSFEAPSMLVSARTMKSRTRSMKVL
jgi:hypothetical protein